MSQSSPAPSKNSALVVSDKTYSTLKHLAAVGLPGLSTLYVALATAWHWPDTAAVVGSIAAINVFVGLFMTLSSNNFANTFTRYAGDLLVSTDGSKSLSLAISSDVLSGLDKIGEVLLKVKQGSAVAPPQVTNNVVLPPTN